MTDIFTKIRELEGVNSYSKHDRFVQGIINAIDQKIISPNDMLPSVNTMIQELKFSPETIRKGYGELVGKGLIESKNRIGYYVTSAQTDQFLRVALMMYYLDTFEEQFYRNFRQALGEQAQVDVFFHNGNIDVFETTLLQNKGKYGMYAIAPIPHPKTKELLELIPRANLLMFDRFEPLDGDFNYVAQEFEKASYDAFVTLADSIQSFNEFVFFHSPESIDPKEIVTSFNRFLRTHSVKGRIVRQFIPGSIKKDTVYFTLDNYVMWTIIKECRAKNFALGKDVGLLSLNDEPAKEIVGITTFSSDFSRMGWLAGQTIRQKGNIQLILPTELVRRSTL